MRVGIRCSDGSFYCDEHISLARARRLAQHISKIWDGDRHYRVVLVLEYEDLVLYDTRTKVR